MTIPTKAPAWSWSALSAFETCAKQYYHLRVAKDVRETPGEATVWGKEGHKHLENRIKDGTPLPVAFAAHEKIAMTICNSTGEKFTEQQLAVTSSFKPTGWWDKDAWCRGIIDVGVRNGDKATLLDFKFGKRKTDTAQLQLFAGLAFSHYPEVKTVMTGFVWLKAGKIDKATYTRSDIPVIWNAFAPRVARLERAYEEGKFPPKPSGLCGKWCPVPHSKCSFSGRQG